MIGEIRIYVEGGGDQKDTKARLRQGFGAFLGELRELARTKRIRWNIVACGGRRSTFDDFKTALRTHPEAFNVLLVDAEGPVHAASPREHLKSRPDDNWDNPGAEDRQCHLMVQTMEAWLVADRQKLREYYGQGFRDNALPNNPNVEQIPKETLARALQNATRDTSKGIYHKTRHAPAILEAIRSDEVRSKAPHCDRLYRTIRSEIDAP